ncbi:hypothetical protein CUN85_06840 [Methanolobus halotolerans]|uniref:Uncharacterized protein n=1 Tax=Methanolobus halotolerans TaxID=2052935 RepID=A0A4E0Q6A1_9EURY|nr:hypothetical protein CUN85_06840 [Methanolobus halotolerans]
MIFLFLKLLSQASKQMSYNCSLIQLCRKPIVIKIIGLNPVIILDFFRLCGHFLHFSGYSSHYISRLIFVVPLFDFIVGVLELDPVVDWWVKWSKKRKGHQTNIMWKNIYHY